MLKDPGSGGSEADIRTQTALMSQLRSDLDSVVAMVNAIEVTRNQLVSLRNVLADDTTMAGIRTEADSLEQKLSAVEHDLVQLQLTGRGQDDVRYPMKLMGRIGWLADGVGGSDLAPTTQQVEVQRVLEEQMRATRTRLDALMQSEVASFNAKLARKRGQGALIP